MHPSTILQLDRMGWILAPHFLGSSLRHATGPAFVLYPHGQICEIFGEGPSATSLILQGIDLEAHAADPVGHVLQVLEAAVSPKSHAEFAQVYRFIRDVLCVVGYQGNVVLERQASSPFWDFEDTTDPQVFGDFYEQVYAALERVQHVSIPQGYGEPTVSGDWTCMGTCTWDITPSMHERLEVIERFQQQGLLPA